MYWAGVQPDPFGVNGIMEDFVYWLWCTVYPSLAHVVEGPGQPHDIILQLISHSESLYNYQFSHSTRLVMS